MAFLNKKIEWKSYKLIIVTIFRLKCSLSGSFSLKNVVDC